MRVKIGRFIYDSDEQPIMLILSASDKLAISHMGVDCTLYCPAPADMAIDRINAFMHEETR